MPRPGASGSGAAADAGEGERPLGVPHVLAAGVGLLAPACGGSTNSAAPGAGDPNNPITTPGGDVPCEVAAVLAKCTGCHSYPPTQAAPMALVSAADLAADSPYYPGQNEATRALARMSDLLSATLVVARVPLSRARFFVVRLAHFGRAIAAVNVDRRLSIRTGRESAEKLAVAHHEL